MLLTRPSPSFALNVAGSPSSANDPFIVTVGWLKYPLPGLTIFT